MILEKPEPRKKAKARDRRHESQVVKAVRAEVVTRDGYCRFANAQGWAVAGSCNGPSEWAHAESHRRSATRGQDPERRHTTAGSFMACKKHHDMHDKGAGDNRLRLTELTDRGMDGRLKVERGDGRRSYSEPHDPGGRTW